MKLVSFIISEEKYNWIVYFLTYDKTIQIIRVNSSWIGGALFWYFLIYNQASNDTINEYVFENKKLSYIKLLVF